MINPESIKQVIDRTNIVEIIGQFINLKKRGVNYIANCPFHNEKSPSFNVNPSKGIFKCFGCGKGGDAITFVEEHEKFTFTEAIRWLAEYYQIELEETEASEEYKQFHQTEESLRVINEFATQYFHDILLKNEEGTLIGGSYFKERGFKQHIIEQFKLGYCLDQWHSFLNEAIAKGYNPILLEKAGLIKTKQGSDNAYDTYKGRVIFPIFGVTGRVVGFGARILKKSDTAPKYINTSENELYIKSKVLYGLYQSKQGISKENECFLVEGYTDVISLHQNGITNVVSSSGTSLTEGQLKLIGNLTKNLTILYDGDAAGIKAALRGLDMAIAQSFNVKLVLLPEGEDPDSYVQNIGFEAFKDYIESNKRDIISFRLEVGLKEVGNDPVKKSNLVNEIADTISKIDKTEDFTIQQWYIKESAFKLNISEDGLINLVNKYIRERIQQDQKSTAKAKVEEEELLIEEQFINNSENIDNQEVKTYDLSKSYKEEWHLIKLLIEYGEKPYQDTTVAEHIFSTVDTDLFEHPLAQKIVETYLHFYQNTGHFPEIKFFTNHPDKVIKEKMATILQDLNTPSHNWQDMHKIEVLFGADIYENEINSTIAYLELKFIRKIINDNVELLKTEKDLDQIKILINTHQILKEKEKQLLSIVIIK